jgi:hypothetical protein
VQFLSANERPRQAWPFNNLTDIVGQELEKLIEDAESTKS